MHLFYEVMPTDKEQALRLSAYTSTPLGIHTTITMDWTNAYELCVRLRDALRKRRDSGMSMLTHGSIPQDF